MRYLFLTSLIAIPSISNPYYALVGATILFIIMVHSTMRSTGVESYEDLESEELENFLKSLGDKNFKIKLTSSESGAVIHRLWQPNIYIIPNHTEPSKCTIESKAVLSHEYSHVKGYDKIKLILFDISSMLSCALFLSLTTNVLSFIVFVFACIFLLPMGRNYLKHRFEYKADKFAVESTTENAVQNRLRRNAHLEPEPVPFIPYSTSHPRIRNRMNKVHNRNDTDEKT